MSRCPKISDKCVYPTAFRLPILRGTRLIQCALRRLLLRVLRHLAGAGVYLSPMHILRTPAGQALRRRGRHDSVLNATEDSFIMFKGSHPALRDHCLFYWSNHVPNYK